MITTKRQITRESDRFGGYYGMENGGFPLISDFDAIGNTEPISDTGSSMLRSDIDTDITTPAAPATDGLYTTLETAKSRPQVTQRTYTPPVREPLPPRQKKKAKREKEDILPSVKTRAYATDVVEQEEERVVEKERERAHSTSRRGAVDLRTKVILCIYVAVALILAIAVIATGVIVSKANAQADDLASSVAQKQALVATQREDLRAEMEAMPEKAAGLGMVSASENPSYTATPVENVGYPAATPKSGAFDKFCDWLSKVIN